MSEEVVQVVVPFTHNLPQMQRTRGTTEPYSTWKAELSNMALCKSAWDGINSLRSLDALLTRERISREDRVSVYLRDFEHVMRLMSGNPQVYSSSLRKAIAAFLKKHFSLNYFDGIHSLLMKDIILWLEVRDLYSFSQVCRDWNSAASSDLLWKILYIARFQDSKFQCSILGDTAANELKLQYRSRLEDPFAGDKVQVCWRGKFRLESADLYHGLAWWHAEIVDKDTANKRYKIRFPGAMRFSLFIDHFSNVILQYTGWDSDRWDEWVPREKIRFPTTENSVEKIKVGDPIEIFCLGKNVPGAWLEAVVFDVIATSDSAVEMYAIENVLVSNERLLLPRSRIRKSFKASAAAPSSTALMLLPNNMPIIEMNAGGVIVATRALLVQPVAAPVVPRGCQVM